MSGQELLLLLHLLAAICLVATVVLLTTVLLAPPAAGLSTLARRLWDIGGAGTLVFGVWLALSMDAYSITDGWILAALVLWAIAAGVGMRVGQGAQEGQRLVGMHVLMTITVLALLVVMIFKPGAG